jgi:predicted nucleotidyltransferase
VVRAEDDIKKIKEALSPVFKNSGAKKVVLFGSIARGSQTKKSDLDLMIIAKTDKRFFERYEQFEEIHDIIDDRAVDMLIYTTEELFRISHRPFIKQILSEGETIYES